MVKESTSLLIVDKDVFLILFLSSAVVITAINLANAFLKPLSITFSLLKFSLNGSMISTSVISNILAREEVVINIFITLVQL